MLSKKKDWEIFEEDVAHYLDGKRQDGSGNSPIAFKKGDVKNDTYLVECKFTTKPAYTLKAKTWEKIVEEATNSFRIPLFACRSQAGDFFVGNEIDFDVSVETEIMSSPSVTIKESFKMRMLGERTTYDIVCWEVNLNE